MREKKKAFKYRINKLSENKPITVGGPSIDLSLRKLVIPEGTNAISLEIYETSRIINIYLREENEEGHVIDTLDVIKSLPIYYNRDSHLEKVIKKEFPESTKIDLNT